MSGWIMLAAAILPAAILWIYIWKKDSQPEPTSWLVKAVIWNWDMHPCGYSGNRNRNVLVFCWYCVDEPCWHNNASIHLNSL